MSAEAGAPGTPGLSGRVDPARVAGIAERLRGRAPALRARPVAEIVDALGSVGERFLDDSDVLRREALDRLPEDAGTSPEMARAVLDGMARDWTRARLRKWLDAEFGDPGCLDGLRERSGRKTMAVGPRLCVQIVAGSVPGVGVGALLRSLLVKAPTLLKPGRGDVLLPTLFARGLAEADPDLAACTSVTYWPGGSSEVERAAFAGAETVVVYGSDETVTAVRALVPPIARLVAYHHRVGVAVVGRDALGAADAAGVAAALSRAVALFDQRGCVCPHLALVEEGGEASAEAFAALVAEALGELAESLPSGAVSLEEAAALRQLRSVAELQEASGDLALRHGGEGAAWTVLYEPTPVPGPPTLARGLRVRPIERVERAAEILAPLGPHLQTIGVAGLGARAGAVAEALGRVGAARVAPLEDVSFPPPWWMHDGRGPLQDLVRWVELESG